MKNKKGRRERCRRHRDLISDLPLSIIHTILSLLPFKEAVRTSLLSKQWRFAWVSLHYLKFDDDDRLPGQTDSELTESENRVISHALRRHKGPILRFEISFSEELKFPKLKEWILFLSRNDIRELVIVVNYFKFNMDESIYSCLKLTHLEVYCARFGRPPSTFNGFPFLRCLSLQYCKLSYEVQSLLVNSPLLERLTLDHSSKRSKLRINLPYLKYFCLKGSWKEIHLCAPLLTELYVEMLDDWWNDKPPRYHQCNYTNLEKICGNEYLIQILRTVMESSNRTLVFSRLKEIELDWLDFEEIEEMTSVVVRLLNGAPNLQKLSLTARGDFGLNDIIGCEPNFTFEKLRFVTMYGVCSYVFGIELVKVLLESSPALVTMNIEEFIDENYENLKADLLAFRRASPNAQIFLNGSRLVVD